VMTTELVRQRHRRIHLPQFVIHLQLSFYPRLIIGLLFVALVMVTGTIALTRSILSPVNPFAAYEDLISGDMQEPEFWANYESLSHAAFELACTTTYLSGYCSFKPETGLFAEISFIYLKNEGANGIYAPVRGGFASTEERTNPSGETGIYFIVRGHALTVGDLALLWGRPTIARRANRRFLRWRDQHMSTSLQADNRQFNYWLPVQYLILESPSYEEKE
jgi:hypothetical protein